MNDIQWTPPPHAWFQANIFYLNEGGWAFATLNDGATEIFIPAPVRVETISEELAVRLRPNTKGLGKRMEATEAMDLNQYMKLTVKTEEIKI